MVINNKRLLGIDERLRVSWGKNYSEKMSTFFTFWIFCTSEHMVHHVQVFRDVRGKIRKRGRIFCIFWLVSQILHVILRHPVDEVDMAEMPTDGPWVLWRWPQHLNILSKYFWIISIIIFCLQHLLHHGWPADMLLGDDHLVDVQDGDVLKPVLTQWERFNSWVV